MARTVSSGRAAVIWVHLTAAASVRYKARHLSPSVSARVLSLSRRISSQVCAWSPQMEVDRPRPDTAGAASPGRSARRYHLIRRPWKAEACRTSRAERARRAARFGRRANAGSGEPATLYLALTQTFYGLIPPRNANVSHRRSAHPRSARGRARHGQRRRGSRGRRSSSSDDPGGGSADLDSAVSRAAASWVAR
jgi:hypothetical protein